MGGCGFQEKCDSHSAFHCESENWAAKNRSLAKANSDERENGESTSGLEDENDLRPSDWVYASPAKNGMQPYWPKSIYRVYIKRAADKIGLRKRIGWHTFRHTFGTILNTNRENPKVIQEFMRHANLKVTMDTYVQAVTDEKREAQNKLVKMILPGIQRAVI
jgi:Phage integrase family